MNLRPLRVTWLFLPVLLSVFLAPLSADELKKSYYAKTSPGAWSEYLLTASDGSKTSLTYERQANRDGKPIIQTQIKMLEGPSKGTKWEVYYTLPQGFDFDRDGLNYG